MDLAELPLQHIVRPKLPWRCDEAAKTECGRKPDAHAISRDEAVAKVKKQGKTRAALTTCMTCWETAARHPDWDQAPSMVIKRYIKNRWWSGWGNSYRYDPEDETVKLDAELRAVWDLIQAHPEEFEELLFRRSQPNELADRRRKQAEARLRARRRTQL